MFAKYLSSVDSPALHVLHTRRWCSLRRSRFLFWQLPPTGSHVVCFYKFFSNDSASLPAKFLDPLQNTSTFVSTELVFEWVSISPFSRSLQAGKVFCFFSLNKNKFRWQWINYTVTNTELIHFPPTTSPASPDTWLKVFNADCTRRQIPIDSIPPDSCRILSMASTWQVFRRKPLLLHVFTAILCCAANSAIFWRRQRNCPLREKHQNIMQFFFFIYFFKVLKPWILTQPDWYIQFILRDSVGGPNNFVGKHSVCSPAAVNTV